MEYKCNICNEVFESTWNDDEAVKEYEDNYKAEFKQEETSIICDECYSIYYLKSFK